MPCAEGFVLASGVDTGRYVAEENDFPLEGFGNEVNHDAAFAVLPSSDSIRSTTTSDTQSSWQSSNTASTIATSIASKVGKGVGSIWDRIRDVGKVTSTSSASWIKPSKQWSCSGSVADLEAARWLPLEPLRSDPSLRSRSPLDEEKQVIATSPAIHLTFDFDYITYTYVVEYDVFRQWKHMTKLLHALEVDGTTCISMWDELEQMQVAAGDWDARARPGWIIRVLCDDVKGDDWSDADEEDDIDIDGTSRGDGWWFKRWKSRVERNKEGRKKKRRPWLVGAIAMVAVSVSFCTVLGFSSTEVRVVME